MLSKIKIWHFLLGALGIIFIVRLGFIVDTFLLIASFFYLLFVDFNGTINQFDWLLLDYLVSATALLFIPVVIFIYRNRVELLFKPSGIVSSFLAVLLLLVIFAPIISPSSPDFQHDISVAKLLPPLSSKTIITLEENLGDMEASKKINMQKRTLKPTINSETLFVCDRAEVSDEIRLWRNGNEKIITKEFLLKNKFSIKKQNITFILGTDSFGRDLFSRIIYGTRLSVLIGLSAVLISLIVGILFGFISGYFGGLVDTVFNRLTEMFMAFPMIFLIIMIVALFGSSLLVIILILGLSGWMGLFKIVRGEVLSLKHKDFLITAQLLGRSYYFILFKEMLPLMLSPVIVHLVLQYSNVIIAESALSYLGLGLGDQYASWGSMIHAGQYYLSQAWWISFFPCLFLFITLILLNSLGKNLEMHFDPRLNR